MKKHRREIDIICQLPDELLIRILSFLPDADATRSRILSNRWKHLWAFLPNHHFVIPQFEKQANKYIDSVHQTLALRGGTPIQKLFLQSSYRLNDYRVNNWLREVEELEFKFYPLNVEFYWNMFRSCNNTLIKLTLQGSFMLLKPEVEITFPRLKKMNLQRFSFIDTNSLVVLLSRCPVLEELCLDSLGLSFNFKVFSPSMKRLTIKECESKYHELVIDAPKLEYLHLMSCYFRRYTLVNPASLVEAHISSRWYVQLLRCVSSTKILTLTCETLLHFGGIRDINLPIFPNLVKLVIGWDLWNLLLILLKNMPNLEYLTFSDELQPSLMKWKPSMEETPACLRFKLKEIFAVSYATWEEVGIINYLLKHATILEKLTINEVYPERHEPWLNIRCVSKSCRIEFV